MSFNALADLSVIHGGIGTVMGKPVVGVGMMLEQEFNIECLVKKGFAKRIRKPKLNAETLGEAIESMLNNESAKIKAEEFSKVMETWFNPGYVRDFFKSTFL